MLTILLAAAATSHAGNPWPALIALGLVVLAGYVLACWFWPLTRCGRCHGAGRFRSPSGRSWRPCPRCGGSGSRERLLGRTRRRD
jgi:hypothetical protein